MAGFDNVKSLAPLWPVKPPDKTGQRRRPPGKSPNQEQERDESDDDRSTAEDKPDRIDEYA